MVDDYQNPGFRPLQICANLQGSAKIVALNLDGPYRSAESLQKCADIFLKVFAEMFFLQLFRKQCIPAFHFWTSSTTLSSILADQGSVS